MAGSIINALVPKNADATAQAETRANFLKAKNEINRLMGDYTNRLFDDFHGAALDANIWDLDSGSDAGALDPAINAQVGGAIRLTAGDAAGTTFTVDGSTITQQNLSWSIDKGAMIFETRLKINTDEDDASVFIGMTDAMAATTLEAPFSLAVATLTSNATDAFGFLYDSAATAANWHAVGVDTDVDDTAVDSGVPPVADAWQKFTITVTAAGVAKFYIDEVLVCTLTAPATLTTALTPIITLMSRTTTAKTADADYIAVEQGR